MAIGDVHIHYRDDHSNLLNLMQELDISTRNTSVAGNREEWHDWRRRAIGCQVRAQHYAIDFAWCTTFAFAWLDDQGLIPSVIEPLP